MRLAYCVLLRFRSEQAQVFMQRLFPKRNTKAVLVEYPQIITDVSKP